MKQILKRRAIKLRKKGLSYTEILRQVVVSKSTLSLWLRSVGLSKRQKQRLTDKKLISLTKGWKVWKEARIQRTKEIIRKAKEEIRELGDDKSHLLFVGAALYWAEGAKEKTYRPGQGIIFSNSDTKVIRIFIQWLKSCLYVTEDQIKFDIYVHESYQLRQEEIRAYWSKNTGLTGGCFGRIYYKKHTIQTKRKNIGQKYFGQLRVRVTKSVHLNRKVAGWIEGICEQCGIV